MILNKGAGQEQAVPLSDARAGKYLVEAVTGPEQRRLSELGIVSGAPMTVLSCSGRNMLVVKIGGSRLALSRGSTDSILVRQSRL